MLALTSVFCALLVPARPPLQRGHGLQAAPRAGLTPSGSGTAALLGAATSSVAAPAVADDGSIVDTAVNLGLSVAVLAFVGVIGKFALEAAGMVGGAMADPGKRIEDALGNDPPAEPKARTPSAGPIFDDSGTGAVTGAVAKKAKGKQKNSACLPPASHSPRIFAHIHVCAHHRRAHLCHSRRQRRGVRSLDAD